MQLVPDSCFAGLAALGERVEALERLNRRLRNGIAALFGLIAGVVLLACAGQSDEASVCRARAFELLAENGEVRGAWTVSEQGEPSFALLDGEKRKRYEVRLKNDALYQRMRDSNDRARITQIVDATSHPHVLLTDVNQKLRVQLAIADSGAPSLVFFHEDGQPSAGVGVHADGRAWLKGSPEDR